MDIKSIIRETERIERANAEREKKEETLKRFRELQNEYLPKSLHMISDDENDYVYQDKYEFIEEFIPIMEFLIKLGRLG